MIFPYLGEKSKLSKFINPNIPKDKSVYVEPFGGSMGTYFSMNLNDYNFNKIIYNDLNFLNCNLFKELKDENFIDLINDIKVTKKVYDNSLKSIRKGKYGINLAIDWLIVLTCSSPYDIGKDTWRGDYKFNSFKVKFAYHKSKLCKIDEIHNKDYKEIIEVYDSYDTFFYLDPPYKNKEDYYINHNFNKDSHKELSKILNKIKGKFLLSYYNFEELSEYYKKCKIIYKPSIMGTEYLIMNY